MNHGFTWFGWLSDKINHHNIHIAHALFVLGVITLVSVLYKKSFRGVKEEVIPNGRFSLKNLFQVLVQWLLELVESIIGPTAKKYFPLIGSIFIYVLLSNLMGVIPGLLPPTDNINTNLAISITVFLYYNYQGIKEQGLMNYLKHMWGPIFFLGPLLLIIELVSHTVRPISLAVRLFGNINGDHIVLGIFSNLVPLGIPVIFLLLGIFVSFVQAFVFTLLTSVYIGLAVAHEDHGHEHGHGHDEAHGGH